MNARSIESAERICSHQPQKVCQEEEETVVKEIRILSDQLPVRKRETDLNLQNIADRFTHPEKLPVPRSVKSLIFSSGIGRSNN